MYSATRSVRAVVLLFVLSFSGSGAVAQFAKFIRPAADPLPLTKLPREPAPCAEDPLNAVAVSNAATPTVVDLSSSCDTPPVIVPTVNPCDLSNMTKLGCNASRDPVQENLATMGKEGQKILRAREKVLEILETGNACTDWFREKDANPAATFRTLSFVLDSKGQEYVLETRDASLDMLHSPYVASVFQDSGAYAEITINRNGAFFFPMASVVKDRGQGGRLSFDSSRALKVGPYWGDTLNAQVLALLHEFGHVIDRLPADGKDQDGKSARNTREVLRYCRAEVESSVRRGTLAAGR